MKRNSAHSRGIVRTAFSCNKRLRCLCPSSDLRLDRKIKILCNRLFRSAVAELRREFTQNSAQFWNFSGILFYRGTCKRFPSLGGAMNEKAKIAVGQVLKDLRAGMDDSALMQKYHLSAKGLQSLFQKMAAKGVIAMEELEQRQRAAGDNSAIGSPKDTEKKGALINPGDAVRDIRAGMHDFDLMSKYKLSSKGLQSLFNHMIKAGLIQQSELDRRMQSLDETVDLVPRAPFMSGGDASDAYADEEELDLNWECPVCGIYQTREYTKCPECGALVALLKRKQR